MKKSNRSGKKKVTISFKTEGKKDVFIAGTFNGWQPEETKLEDNGAVEYTAVLQLPAGRHEYKFVADDVWTTDPQNPETVPNDCGSMNNLLIVE